MKTLKSIYILTFTLSVTACAGLDAIQVKVKEPVTEEARTPAKFDPIDRAQPISDAQKKSVRRLDIEKGDDGRFLIDGKPFIDHHGMVETVSKISETGYITYVVVDLDKDSKMSIYKVKTVDPFTNQKPKVLGVLRKSKEGYYHLTVDETTFTGTSYYVLSKGIVLNKDGHSFTYVSIDEPSKTFPLPPGYKLAPRQKGDASETRHLMMLKHIGNSKTFGIPSKGEHDYDLSLISIDDGTITSTIKMRLDGKGKRDRFKHLTNSFYLYATERGPVTISLEDDYKRLVLRNLYTKQKKIVHERKAGIAFVKAGINDEGKVWVKAADGLKDKYIDNVLGLL